MQKLPRLSGHKVMKALSKAGFTATRQKGSHVIMKKQTNTVIKTTVVPIHKEVDRGTLLEIIRQAGLKKDEFIELL